MKYRWIILFCFTNAFAQDLDDQWNTKALQRLMHEWNVKLEKMDFKLNELKLDMERLLLKNEEFKEEIVELEKNIKLQRKKKRDL